MKVATLDFTNATSSSIDERFEFAWQLVEAFKVNGFVKLTHHGIPIATVRKAFLLVCFLIYLLTVTHWKLESGILWHALRVQNAGPSSSYPKSPPRDTARLEWKTLLH